MPVLLSIFFGIVPMLIFAWIIYWLDRYEKEPAILLGAVFMWGAIVAAGGAFVINTMLGLGVYVVTGSESVTELSTGSLIAPVIEELLKGFAVLVIFLSMRHEFDSIMDGIIYAAVAALGFAATENIYYIYQYGYAESGYAGLFWLVFVRVILVGWQHPFYTAFFGIGLAFARLSRSLPVKLAAPLAGLGVAILAHAFHNTIGALIPGLAGMAVGTLFDWSGWTFMFLFILWALYREQRWLKHYLREEVSLGVITPAQYLTACSAWGQSAARLRALSGGQYIAASRFYQSCGELAHKKHQFTHLGDEDDNQRTIEKLRADLASLSPHMRV